MSAPTHRAVILDPNPELRLSRPSPRRLSSLSRWSLAAALPVMAAGLLWAGCGGGTTEPTNPTPTTPGVRSLLDKPLVAGHRGAAGRRPEHTLASYTRAIELGADIIEPDLVPTKDGKLVARHENYINDTTNVSTLAKFADRKTTKTIDGTQLTGWFTEDFTLAELKELRARERIPVQRPTNTQFNDQFEVPTLEEIIALAESMSASTGRTIHIFPETKHPTYFKSIGLPLEDELIRVLKAHPFTANTAKVYLQSFETANLRELHTKIGSSQPNWILIQLMEVETRQPYDFVAAKDPRTYKDLMTPEALKDIATYANGIGPSKVSIINVDASGALLPASALVADAHAANLLVMPYTFRPENFFLPATLRTSDGDAFRNEAGSVTEIQAYLKAGIDGFFTDDAGLGRQAVDTFKP